MRHRPRAEDGLFFARRGAFAFPYRRAGGASLSAGAAYTRDVEEAAHHAEVVSPTFGRAASIGLARCRSRCRDDLDLWACFCDRLCEWRSDQQHKRSREQVEPGARGHAAKRESCDQGIDREQIDDTPLEITFVRSGALNEDTTRAKR